MQVKPIGNDVTTIETKAFVESLSDLVIKAKSRR